MDQILLADIERFEWEIKRTDKIVQLGCWDKEEAQIVRDELERRGIDSESFFCTWLKFDA